METRETAIERFKRLCENEAKVSEAIFDSLPEDMFKTIIQERDGKEGK